MTDIKIIPLNYYYVSNIRYYDIQTHLLNKCIIIL